MEQLQVGTIKPCKCCRKRLPLTEMHGWTKVQYRPAKDSPIFEHRLRLRPQISFFICSKCWPDSFANQALTLYKSLESRESRNFKQSLTFTYEQFYDWLKNNGYTKMLNRAKRRIASGLDRTSGGYPSIDRINSFDGYNLNNMQVLPIGENVTKGSGPAIAAKLRTMRFFKKLRKETGKTKYEMAKHLGMLPQTYFYLEEKARGCSFEILCLIKKKLDLDWNVLGAMIEDEVVITKKDKAKEAKASESSPS